MVGAYTQFFIPDIITISLLLEKATGRSAQTTRIESHELMEFFIRIQSSTYGIFHVKSLSESQPRGVSLDLYFIYVSRYCPDKLPSVDLQT